jgi:DNA modification methylase
VVWMKHSIQKVILQPNAGEELLVWSGKRKLTEVNEVEANTVSEYFTGRGTHNNHLFFGNNYDVLCHLLTTYKEKVDLIYIDPPFESQANYSKKIFLKGMQQTAPIYQTQYEDKWAHHDYLQFIYERLQLLRTLLSPTGSIYVHCDWRKAHHIRLMLDEIFGTENYRNEIIWKRGTVKGAKAKGNQFARNHDTIFYYTKTSEYTFNRQYIPFDKDYMKRFNKDDGDGLGPYRDDQAIGTRSQKAIAEMKASGKIFEHNGKLRIKTYLKDLPGIVVDDNWSDIAEVNVRSKARTMYPTQKPEELLERIIKTSTNEGDLVLDCFSGSGTTVAVAAKLNRQFIGVDNNIGAIQTATMRLQKLQAPFIIHVVNREWPKQHVNVQIHLHETTKILEIVHVDFSYLHGKKIEQSDNWKQLIETVQIDWKYDGKIFRPTDFDTGNSISCIAGKYKMPERLNGTKIALQLIDIFSNQLFITIG